MKVIPPGLVQALGPVLEQIASLTVKIKHYDRLVKQHRVLAVGALHDATPALLKADRSDKAESSGAVEEEQNFVAQVVAGVVRDVADVPEKFAEGEGGGCLTFEDVVDCKSEDEGLEMVVAWVGFNGRGDDAALDDLAGVRTEIGEIARQRNGSALGMSSRGNTESCGERSDDCDCESAGQSPAECSGFCYPHACFLLRFDCLIWRIYSIPALAASNISAMHAAYSLGVIS